ncbi:hypothetical protein [Glycomyces buryatensis]|uniref:Secreted protein n=1 Tax=Glycomyces buryatensis TaxID=2570927 RepID=A0A4S8QBI1_9ACTN|nr:hypothetical protein [Glycomyces buryatensis]THV40891.1 hypothetical protein FAB82_13640 [Glycomyces buryatensis]
MMQTLRLSGPALATFSLTAALLLSGCGTDSASSPDESPATETASTPATSEPAISESASDPAPLDPADGTDYTACADGNCEVAISEPTDIEFDGSTGPGTLAVIDILDDGLALQVTLPGGGGDSELKGRCTLHFSAGGGSMDCPADLEATPEPPEPAAGVLSVQLAGMTDGTAILRLALG